MPDDDLSGNKSEVLACNNSCLLYCAPTQSSLHVAGLKLAILLMIDTFGNSKPSTVKDSGSAKDKSQYLYI